MARAKLNSRAKGKRRELQWAHLLKSWGFPAERTAQRCGKGGGPFDVEAPTCPIPCWEVKGVEELNLVVAIDRATEDSQGRPWALAWKRNHRDWVVAMSVELLQELLQRAAR